METTTRKQHSHRAEDQSSKKPVQQKTSSTEYQSVCKAASLLAFKPFSLSAF